MLIAWVLLTITGIVVRSMVWNRMTRGLDASGEATRVEQSLSQLSSSLQDAEASQRGYLLTANEGYLEPFKQTEATLPSKFSELAEAARQDSALEKDLLELRGLTELKMVEMRDTISLRRTKGLKEALAVMNSGKGRETMEKLRKVMWRMRQRRQVIFSSAWENTRQNLEWVQTTGLWIGFLGLGAGLFALYFVRVSFVQERARWSLSEEKLRAENTVVEKNAYLANMSHELRTPMNAILGFGELLEGEALTSRQAQYVRAIRASGTSLLQLVNDVLDLSKLEAGKLELHLEPTNMREICDFLHTMFGQQAALKHLQLKLELGPMPRALLLDRLRLRQVLVNLVGNAVKFTRQGHVSLRVHWQPLEEDRSRGILLIEVEDSGVGIPPENQENIFKPFVQATTPRPSENEGTGLGLSIVQRLTAAMGGTIALQSTPGAGSVFRLRFAEVSISSRLPVGDALEAETSVDFNDFAPATILAVDDNQTNRDLMIGLFEGTHHHLRLAGNGEEALKSLAEIKPDLVLVDIRMPVLDGWETLAEIRRRKGLELLPVVAVAASIQTNDNHDLRGRFSGFIRKPYSRLTLYKELAQFLPRSPGGRETGSSADVRADNAPTLPATARKADTPEAAMSELGLLQQSQWLRLRDSLAINETLAFARKLRELGRNAQSKTLTTYADRLTADAEAYAVGDLERSLAEFPALVRSLDQSGELSS